MPRSASEFALTQIPEYPASDPLTPYFKTVAEFITRVLAAGFEPGNTTRPGEELIAQFIADLPRDASPAYATLFAEWALHYDKCANAARQNKNDHEKGFSLAWRPRQVVAYSLRPLLRRKLPLDERAIFAFARWIASAGEHIHDVNYPVSSMVRAISNYAESSPLSSNLRISLANAALTVLSARDPQMRRFGDEIDRILRLAPPHRPPKNSPPAPAKPPIPESS